MSFTSAFVRFLFGKGDRIKNKGLTTPEDIMRFDDIEYGEDKKYQVLDVYRPKNKEGELPVVVSVHGGGWVYGDKELYQYYCMSLAQRGFAVVNFSYRLAPEYKYPSGMEDINSVFTWMLNNAETYGIDCDHIFAVGDSAGAHQLALYCCMLADPGYCKRYDFRPTEKLQLKAIALNCGVYDLCCDTKSSRRSRKLMRDLFTERGTQDEIELVSPILHMKKGFPPSYVMTATGDFLREQAPVMVQKLEQLEIRYEYKVYGTTKNKLPHVFHCNLHCREAVECNTEECDFFRKFC